MRCDFHFVFPGSDLEALEYRAVHAYHSGAEGDLVFSEGDAVLVYWGQDNGWWYGAFGGQQGWFPESYVEVSALTSIHIRKVQFSYKKN